ncbi:Translation initiation factor 1A [Nesidiocoris tenuis]|uniref:Probable RNA-binding protein EIF1AD n=1 Tax=Nesidiocoris tenuis TaxID=355587 RepID=A0ABN7AS26_9HEMI|nr:Translation initiation factor 1A [Nesidiocoris tenuis]
MSKITKRKHTIREATSTEHCVPAENQMVVKLLEGRGNNLHCVESADGATFLVSMPTKFRKNIWIKRGDFLLIDILPDNGKVRGEIATIIDSKFVKFLKNSDCWPKAFDNENVLSDSPNNRPTFEESSDSSDSSESS